MSVLNLGREIKVNLQNSVVFYGWDGHDNFYYNMHLVVNTEHAPDSKTRTEPRHKQ